MFRDRGECEIMVCGAFVKKIFVLGDSKNGIKDKTILEEYSNTKSNMQRFSKHHKGKDASISNAKINKIAKRIVSNFY